MNTLKTNKIKEAAEVLCGRHSSYYDSVEYKGVVFSRNGCNTVVQEKMERARKYIGYTIREETPPLGWEI